MKLSHPQTTASCATAESCQRGPSRRRKPRLMAPVRLTPCVKRVVITDVGGGPWSWSGYRIGR